MKSKKTTKKVAKITLAHLVLSAVAHTSLSDIYGFLITDLNSKINQVVRNTRHWQFQINHIKTKGSVQDKTNLTSYQSMVKKNNKAIKQYREAIQSLTKAQKAFIKGIHYEI